MRPKKGFVCFRCNEEGHLSRNCPKNQQDSQVAHIGEMPNPEEDFRQGVEYQLLHDGERFTFKFDTLFDTGSPISFIKEKFILNNAINEIDERESERFFGINSSRLKILGKINLDVSMNGVSKEGLTLLVVDDNTISASVVLGRDILREFNLKLIHDNVTVVDEALEIRNIDVTDEKGETICELNVNPEILSAIKIKII